MSVGIKIIAVIGGFLAFFVACTGISFAIDSTTEFLSGSELTEDMIEPMKPTFESWSARFQVAAWTGLIAFITLLVPVLPYKLPILLLEILGGIIAWIIV